MDRIDSFCDRLHIIHDIIQPGRLPVPWFQVCLREMGGLEVPSATLYRWYHEGIPDDKRMIVEQVLLALAIQASHELGAQMDRLGAAL